MSLTFCQKDRQVLAEGGYFNIDRIGLMVWRSRDMLLEWAKS
jgi:hypothetical protein